jgi:hypothetical protein
VAGDVLRTGVHGGRGDFRRAEWTGEPGVVRRRVRTLGTDDGCVDGGVGGKGGGTECRSWLVRGVKGF